MEVNTPVMLIKVINYHITTCKLCTNTAQCQNIYNLKYNEMTVKDIFCYCTNVEMSNDNSFYVCIACTSKLIGTYKFIKTCKEAWHAHALIFNEKDNHDGVQKFEIEEDDGSYNSEVYEEECGISDEDRDSDEVKKTPMETIEIVFPDVKTKLMSGDCKTEKEFDEKVNKEIEALHNRDAGEMEKIIQNSGQMQELFVVKQEIIDGNSGIIENMISKTKRVYECTVCQQEFTVKRKFNRHLLVHIDKRKICEHCNKTFESAFALKKHKLTEHPHDKSYDRTTTCFLCNTVAPTIKDLKKHLFTSHHDNQSSGPRRIETETIDYRKGGRPAASICHICGKGFKARNYLKLHIYSHLGVKPHACDVCGKRFTALPQLKLHSRVHTGEKPYSCTICSKSFASRANLIYHIRSAHTNSRPHLCNVCGKSFVQRPQLTRHLQSHEGMPTVTAKGEKLFPCKLCLEIYPTKSEFQLHKCTKMHLAPFICETCGKGFNKKQQLVVHVRLHTGECPYVCEFCSKGFRSRTILRVHVQTHTGEKPYVCESCGKGFTQEGQLATHRKVHSDEKAFMCELCGKSFRLKGTLTVHLRTHTGEKRYGCDRCEKRYSSSKNLKKHKAKCGVELVVHKEDGSFVNDFG